MQATPEHFASAHHGNERRAKPRHAPKSLAYVNVGDANGGVIVDISETGMSIASAEPLEQGAAPRLRFQLPHVDRTFEVAAEMIWSADSKTKAGVRFVSMPIDDRIQIRNWIKDELFAEAFPARIASTMIPRRRLPFSFEAINESSATATSRETQPAVPAKVLPDIPVAIPSHTADAFEKMFPSESTLDPQIVKRTGHALSAAVSPSQPSIDTSALWMNFPSEQDVAPRVVEYDVEPVAAEASAPAEVSTAQTLHIEDQPTNPAEEAAPSPIIAGVAAAPLAEQSSAPPSVEKTSQFAALTSAPVETIETVEMPLETAQVPVAPVIIEVEKEEKIVPPEEPSALPAVAEPAVIEAPTAPTPKIAPRAAVPTLAIAEFEMAPPILDLPEETFEESLEEVPVHELHPVAEGPAFAASHMDQIEAVDIAQAVRAPGKFTGGAVSDASIESLLAIAAAEEAFVPVTPRKPLSVVPNPTPQQTPSQPRSAAPVKQAAKSNASTAAPATLPHVALRTAAQQSVAPQKLIDADQKFHGLLIAAAIVFLALCFVIGYSRNVHLPWTKEATPANTTPSQPDPSAQPTNDAAPSSSSKSTGTPTAAAQVNSASLSPLPDSASVAPSDKFEAPPLPAASSAPATPSYFPVTAPAGGDAPRMVELPEKTVFESPKVLIHLRQYFFVPSQPGPEWSHKLDQIQVGEPTMKMPPPPASDRDSNVVHLRATFGKDGAVKTVRPIDGPVALIPRSVEAVRQWRYQPSVLDGAPLEWQGDFTIEFRPAS
jgi:hypothetical protein